MESACFECLFATGWYMTIILGSSLSDRHQCNLQNGCFRTVTSSLNSPAEPFPVSSNPFNASFSSSSPSSPTACLNSCFLVFPIPAAPNYHNSASLSAQLRFFWLNCLLTTSSAATAFSSSSASHPPPTHTSAGFVCVCV